MSELNDKQLDDEYSAGYDAGYDIAIKQAKKLLTVLKNLMRWVDIEMDMGYSGDPMNILDDAKEAARVMKEVREECGLW